MRKYRTGALLGLVVALAVVVALIGGCKPSGTNTTTTTGKQKLKIGVETGLTGGLADYGFTAAEAAKLKAKELNAKGITIGGKQYELQLVVKDDKGEPAEAPVVAQALVDQGVKGVIGTLTSGNANAAGPIYSQANIPQITASATLADLTTKGWKNFFRDCVGDNIQGAQLGKWVQELGFKKVVIVDDSGDYSVGLANNVETQLKTDASIQILRQAVKEKDTDFSAQIANIKKFGPDALVFTGYHLECGLLRKQMVEAGLGKVQMLGGDGIKSDEFAAEAGGEANAKGVLCTIGAFGAASPEELPGYATFKASYKAAVGKDPGTYAEGNYDALGALVAAMEKAGSTDSAAVIAALHSIEYTGVMGTFGFNETGDMVGKGASANVETIFRYKNDGKTFLPTK